MISELKKEDLSDALVDRILFEGLADTGEKADCIIVLGSSKASVYRVPVTARAYLSGRADKMILCGGKIRAFPQGPMSEAQHMRICAESLGVKKEDIFVDERSLNTVENILQAMVILQRNFSLSRIGKVLLVTTAYHMRRSLCVARYLFPDHIEVMPCPADDTHTSRNTWMDDPAGRARALKEVHKIIAYVREGVFPDLEIQPAGSCGQEES
ncbi:MAG: YdcF family protein [Oscillospiraceae bacterium]|nr:YdcF family protein [Oscillospiraceae bacterium]